MEKSGFVYIWFDRKHKRYYIGSHWGTPLDGYICSSRWMRKAYRRRPEDFKRRLLSKKIERPILLAEEHRWLAKIKDEELGIRYYNLTKHLNGHWSHSDSKLTVGGKISKALKGKPNKSSGKFKSGDLRGLQTRFAEGHSTHNAGKTLEERYGENSIVIRNKMSVAKKGKSLKNAGSFGNRPVWNKGLSRIWITDGSSNRCLYGDNPIPTGWARGRSKIINNDETKMLRQL